MIGKIWSWLHDADWKTHIAHGAQAVLIMLLGMPLGGIVTGLYANAVHWVLREGPGIVIAAWSRDTAKLKDGLGDLFGPLVGIALFVLVWTLV